MKLPRILRRVLGGDPAEAVDEELRFHIEERIEELVRLGRSPEAARADVYARFGDVEAIRAACERLTRQRMDREGMMTRLDGWWHDARWAARSLVRAPGFSVLVAITLALGIGATTAVFSVVDGVLLRPLPFGEPDRLVVIWQNDRATGTLREPASLADYFDFRSRMSSVSAVGGVAQTTANLTRTDADPLQIDALQATWDLTDVLGLEIARGRSFSEDEGRPGGPNVALVSHGFWERVLAGREDVVGSQLVLNEVPFTVVGVLAEGANYPDPSIDVWVPLTGDPATASRQTHSTTLLARLAPGATVARADAEAKRLAAELEAAYPANANRGAFVEPLADVFRGDVRGTLWAVFAAVLAVLAIACVNAANLFLARGSVRVREVGVATALGGSRGRLARRFLIESLLLTFTAATAGLAIAYVGLEGLLALAPEGLDLSGVGVDLRVLGFTVAASALVGVLLGLVPVAQLGRADVRSALGGVRGADGNAPGGTRARKVLVAGQVALAVVLLSSAGLFMRTVANLQAVDPGFRPDDLLRLDFQLPRSRYPVDFSTWPDNPERLRFSAEVVRRVEAVPGVSRAALTTNHPLQQGFTNSFAVEGRAADPDQGEMTTRLVGPGYFETVGLDLVEGRLPTRSEDHESPWVLVLNRAAAERYFPDGDALGQRITFFGPTMWREVVGIVENERVHGLDRAVPPTMYASVLQAPGVGRMTLMVKTGTDPMEVLPAVRRAFWSVDPSVPLFNVSTMEATLRQAVARERFAFVLLGIFAAIALLLSVLGVHGVLSYVVAQRRAEMGIRLALGATPATLLGLVTRQGAAMVLAGLALGLVGAVLAGKAVEALLFEVDPLAPSTLFGVAVVLTVCAAVGVVRPALRAARTAPATAMRRSS